MIEYDGLPETSWGSASHHQRVMVAIPAGANRGRKCDQDECGGPVTHMGEANGMALMMGCEWSVRRWVAGQDQAELTRYRVTGER